jgi:hypothetical protein
VALTDLVKLAGGGVRLSVEQTETDEQGGEVTQRRTYIATPLTFTDLAAYEEEFGDISDLKQGTDCPHFMRGSLFLVWRILRHRQKNMTREEAGDLFGADQADKIDELISTLMPAPKAEAGEDPATSLPTGG